MTAEFAAPILALFVAFAGVWATRAWALRFRLLDHPNERSSHSIPVPRGGGAGLVAGVAAAIALGCAQGAIAGWALGALALSLGIAWIGWLDDRRGMSARTRMAVQFALALAWVGYEFWRARPTPAIVLGDGLAIAGPSALVFAALFIVWMTNLHNFMDGVDGMAASQAIAVSIGAAAVATLGPGDDSIKLIWFAIAAASAGFLAWNWSPAKIFMGDVGSAFLGFLIAAIALRWESSRPGALAIVCVLDAAFIVDATWTLVARAIRRKRLTQAHRSHAYQIAARALGSHARVAAIVLIYDVVALYPLALMAAAGRLSPLAAFVIGGAPVAGACAWLEAGREPGDAPVFRRRANQEKESSC